MLRVFDVLIRIASQLRWVVEESGFSLADTIDAGDITQRDGGDQATIQMLSFRSMRVGMPTTLLEFCHLPSKRWITATLWRPDDLLGRIPAFSVDDIALHHQTWDYHRPTDLESLLDVIAAEVTSWLKQPTDRATPLAATEDELDLPQFGGQPQGR